MASSWGGSWGSAWRDAWGAIFADPGAIRGHAHGSAIAVARLTSTGEQPAESVGGTPDRKKKPRVGWVYNPLPVIEPTRGPVEEVESMILCGAL
jgi:hypothetical protein